MSIIRKVYTKEKTIKDVEFEPCKKLPPLDTENIFGEIYTKAIHITPFMFADDAPELQYSGYEPYADYYAMKKEDNDNGEDLGYDYVAVLTSKAGNNPKRAKRKTR